MVLRTSQVKIRKLIDDDFNIAIQSILVLCIYISAPTNQWEV